MTNLVPIGCASRALATRQSGVARLSVFARAANDEYRNACDRGDQHGARTLLVKRAYAAQRLAELEALRRQHTPADQSPGCVWRAHEKPSPTRT